MNKGKKEFTTFAQAKEGGYKKPEMSDKYLLYVIPNKLTINS
jgi:hypothetical protein